MLRETSHITTRSSFKSQAVNRAIKCLQMQLYVKIQYEHTVLALHLLVEHNVSILTNAPMHQPVSLTALVMCIHTSNINLATYSLN